MKDIKYKNFTISSDLKTCFVNGEEIELSKLEFNLLFYLITNPNKIHSRKEIINKVWDKEPETRVLDMAISRIRKKLPIISSNIKTKFGYGYGFVKY